nr:2-amino-4-hydroxy-6-hydroxymethyldihydropteridine diphosphokinase [Rhodoferax sp. PAMC 29310]
MVTAYVALGANLGDPIVAIQKAIQDLQALVGVRSVRCSSLYLTAPVDSSGPDYVNAVAELQTDLTAPDLLAGLQCIENTAGRARPYRNAPRLLDLDILTYGQGVINSPLLHVPHPRMFERAFVLIPLAEISPEQVSDAQMQAVAGQAITRLTA